MAAGRHYVPQRQVDQKPGRDCTDDPGPERAERGCNRFHVTDVMPVGVNDESTNFDLRAHDLGAQRHDAKSDDTEAVDHRCGMQTN